MSERFISESLTPIKGSFDPTGIARGEPGMPLRFVWRDRPLRVVDVEEVWKTSSPEGGSGEMYLRRHWWKVRVDTGQVMTIYCERQAKRRNAKSRWFVYTVVDPPGASPSS